MALVPGRECGECTACCRDLYIDDPELVKYAGVLCKNSISGGGCKIYDHRPKACREFYCTWRSTPEIGEGWRPDKIGILMLPKTTGLPPAFSDKDGIQIVLIKPEAIHDRQFHGLLAGLVSARVPLFLSLRPPEGFVAASVFLNLALEDSVRRQDGTALLRELESTVERMKHQPLSPVVLRNAVTR
jgi:hypothetical protein